MSDTLFHDDESLAVDCTVCLARWRIVRRQNIASRGAPATGMLQRHDGVTERQQTANVVGTWNKLSLYANCLWPTNDGRLRLGWPTKICQVDHNFDSVIDNRHV